MDQEIEIEREVEREHMRELERNLLTPPALVGGFTCLFSLPGGKFN